MHKRLRYRLQTDLLRVSVSVSCGRPCMVEGRSARPASYPGPLLSLCVFGWAPGPREMRGSVCSAEPVFWPVHGVGWAPRVLACVAPEPHPDMGFSTRGRVTPATTAPRPARPFRDRLNSQFFAARHHTRAFPVQGGLREVYGVAWGALSRRPPLSRAISAFSTVCCGQFAARLRVSLMRL